MVLFRNMFTAASLILMTAIVFNCSGGGGGRDKRDHLRKEYERDPDAYRKRWGV